MALRIISTDFGQYSNMQAPLCIVHIKVIAKGVVEIKRHMLLKMDYIDYHQVCACLFYVPFQTIVCYVMISSCSSGFFHLTQVFPFFPSFSLSIVSPLSAPVSLSLLITLFSFHISVYGCVPPQGTGCLCFALTHTGVI